MAGRKRDKAGRPGDRKGAPAKRRGGQSASDHGRPAPAPKRAQQAQKTKSGPQPEAPLIDRPLGRHSGALPGERIPLILETSEDPGYQLLDSGAGEKLERYGPMRIVRPEAQALWPRRLKPGEWDSADAVFTGDTEEDGLGRWAFPKAPLGETWPMQLMSVDFYGRLTSFRHVGVFPEQLAHWRFMVEQIEARKGSPAKVLNLFGYTGVASLIAADAGAEVTHVDASKKAIGWARENQALAGLEKKPVRWICEDAMKFLLREEKRGNSYDLILTDPPKFGRGPNGEVWHLFDHLPLMLDVCRAVLSKKPIGLVLTAYSIRASFYSIHELMRETMRGAGGRVESGELIIRETGGDPSEGRALSTSLFSRWLPHE
ncbi:MAG: SAM-dependent methyltransferase [Rhizobiales bacterium]|nr:SAM-dependent methyltransferase [Hyphomicrobiales bacterium]MBA67646.1 SAM-dependent methyltransferase [Hyphomicrobiales bacterium]